MLREGLTGLGILIGYYVLAASLTVLLKRILNPPSELFRKSLHMIVVMSILPLLRVFRTWYAAVLAVTAFALIVYPILALVEHMPQYKKFFAERKKGEVKMSLILVYMMFAVLIAVFWGWLGPGCKYIVVVSVMAWGYGDAAAALVGKAYGRRYIEHRLVEGKKTVEGTLAMFAVSWLAIFITTMAFAVGSPYLCFLVALVVAPVCAVVELFSRHGTDTVTVPFSAAVATFALVSFLTVLGV